MISKLVYSRYHTVARKLRVLYTDRTTREETRR